MMRSMLVVLLLLPALAYAEVTLPESAAGKVASEWLSAINSGDRIKLQAFKETYKRETPIEDNLRMREETGGFTVLRVVRDEPDAVGVLLREKDSDTVSRLDFAVDATKPGGIGEVTLEIVEAPPEFAVTRLSHDAALSALSTRIEELARQDRFSGAVLVARDREVVFERAWGLADRATATPATVDTQFRIGSMNKMFTAVAILQLVEAGKLSLDDTVGTWLTDYPDKQIASKVTLRQLLNHSGGTGDIFDEQFRAQRSKLQTHSDYVRLYGSRAPAFEPGTRDAYSNYGFILLGAIIEKVSGTSYYEHVRTHVFEPAGMRSTASLPESVSVPLRATGYLRSNDRWIPNTDTLPVRGTAAGGGYSTVGDLARFAHALQSGALLPKTVLAVATSGQNNRKWYGFGFMPRDSGVLRSYGHGGGAPGMNGELRIFPELGIVVVSLSNLDPPAAQRPVDHFVNRMPIAAR